MLALVSVAVGFSSSAPEPPACNAIELIKEQAAGVDHCMREVQGIHADYMAGKGTLQEIVEAIL